MHPGRNQPSCPVLPLLCCPVVFHNTDTSSRYSHWQLLPYVHCPPPLPFSLSISLNIVLMGGYTWRQIWTNWRTKKTDGLPGSMMFLWALCRLSRLGEDVVVVHTEAEADDDGGWVYRRCSNGRVCHHSKLQHSIANPAAIVRITLSGQLGTDFSIPWVRRSFWGGEGGDPYVVCNNARTLRLEQEVDSVEGLFVGRYSRHSIRGSRDGLGSYAQGEFPLVSITRL